MTISDSSKVGNGVSVVIATLGANSLMSTLRTLNQGSVVPDEILIIIPTGTILENSFDFNVRIFFSENKGQVAQRILGFSLAKHRYVLQLDDDIILGFDCLENLIDRSSFSDKIAVAPVLLDIKTSTPIYKKKFFGFLGKFYYWMVNGTLGYQPGKFYLSGSGEGISPDSLTPMLNIEWLAGGCILHRRENLILVNYFPFSGKAYCEDFIHSHLLSESGIQMIIEPKALAYLEVSGYSNLALISFIKNQYDDFKARKYFQKIRNINSFRIYIFYLLILLNYLVNKIKFYGSHR